MLLWKKSLSNMLDLIARIEICTYLGDKFSRTSWIWLFMQTIFIKKKRLQGQLTRFTVAIGWNIFQRTVLNFMSYRVFQIIVVNVQTGKSTLEIWNVQANSAQYSLVQNWFHYSKVLTEDFWSLLLLVSYSA